MSVASPRAGGWRGATIAKVAASLKWRFHLVYPRRVNKYPDQTPRHKQHVPQHGRIVILHWISPEPIYIGDYDKGQAAQGAMQA
jgi:hypothetical protein